MKKREKREGSGVGRDCGGGGGRERGERNMGGREKVGRLRGRE